MGHRPHKMTILSLIERSVIAKFIVFSLFCPRLVDEGDT